MLKEIDQLKAVTSMNSNAVALRTIVNEYAHQSVRIEQNSLLLSDSRIIAANLEEKLIPDKMFLRSRAAPALNTSKSSRVDRSDSGESSKNVAGDVDQDATPDHPQNNSAPPTTTSGSTAQSSKPMISTRTIRDEGESLGKYNTARLKHVDLPAANELLPRMPENDVVELRNHILISRWVALNALRCQGTSGFELSEIRDLQALMLRDTVSEQLYAHNWGPRTQPGDYRQIPISSKFNPLRVYPYHFEIPSLMSQWQDWRVKQHRAGILHPLILTCQMTLWFLHIHPFSDGNGRVGRTIMQDYMMRQGYWPCLMQNLERQDYLTMVSDAQDGRAEAFVDRVLRTQFEMLTALVTPDSER